MGLGNEYESIAEADIESEIKNHLKDGIQKVTLNFYGTMELLYLVGFTKDVSLKRFLKRCLRRCLKRCLASK